MAQDVYRLKSAATLAIIHRLRFEWDENKNRENIRKHGIDFEDAKAMFAGLMLVDVDDREEYPEDRWIGIGLIDVRTAVVVYAEIDVESIRIISCRKATTYERQQFETFLRERLEPC